MKKNVTLGLIILMLLTLMGCGDAGTSSNENEISQIIKEYENGNYVVDYYDAASFEKALNDGEKVSGKIVIFDVVDYKPDSALGINCWSGEHLNFISEHEVDVVVSDYVVGLVTEEPSKTLGSWKIPYEVLEIQKHDVLIEIEDLSDENSSTENEVQVPDKVINTEDTTNVEENKEESSVVNVASAEEKQKPAYTITDVSKTMYVKTSANVRSKPDKNEDKVGTLSTNDEVSVTGQVDNGWYRISYNGDEAYVKADLLSDGKNVESVANTNSNNGNEEGNKSTGSGSGGSSVVVPSSEDTQGDLVWVPTKGGKKYHSNSSCSGMQDPMHVTKEHAEANGYTPCKRCH